jgi:cell pole-organizing protein PopZ
MGDVSNEPSMEDILSSIKRIIAEEGESAVASRPRRGARTPAAEPVAQPDEVLELSEPVPAEPPQPAAPPAATDLAPPAEPILSHVTAEATRGPLEQLSRMIVKPEVAGSDTLEGMVRDMLRPMLREWLDANLPRMVEEMVQREITRITSR